MTKVALLYDFDKTLCTKDMQEYSLIPSLGYSDASSFWKEVSKLSEKQKMDRILAYLYLCKEKALEHQKPLCRKDFEGLGKSIVCYPGVETWFQRVNAYGKSLGLEVEHYVISSGMAEIIEGTSIAKEFRKIYACRYYYDASGTAQWPKQVINYTTKTQYIFRINKQVLDENEDAGLNAYVDPTKRPIPFKRMIYIADGITDIPCMRLVKEYGGKSIAVYADQDQVARQLMKDGRVDFAVKADYRTKKAMEKTVFRILDHMAADYPLEMLEGKIQ